jgi:hypothetical protein
LTPWLLDTFETVSIVLHRSQIRSYNTREPQKAAFRQHKALCADVVAYSPRLSFSILFIAAHPIPFGLKPLRQPLWVFRLGIACIRHCAVWMDDLSHLVVPLLSTWR